MHPRLLHLPPQLHLTVAAIAVRPDSEIEKWVEELGPKLGGTTKLAEVVRDDKGGPKKIIIKSIGIPRDKLSYTSITGINLRAPARRARFVRGAWPDRWAVHSGHALRRVQEAERLAGEERSAEQHARGARGDEAE